MKASAVSTITKSLPIALSVLVNYSLLATLGYINLFHKNIKNNDFKKLPFCGIVKDFRFKEFCRNKAMSGTGLLALD